MNVLRSVHVCGNKYKKFICSFQRCLSVGKNNIANNFSLHGKKNTLFGLALDICCDVYFVFNLAICRYLGIYSVYSIDFEFLI